MDDPLARFVGRTVSAASHATNVSTVGMSIHFDDGSSIVIGYYNGDGGVVVTDFDGCVISEPEIW